MKNPSRQIDGFKTNTKIRYKNKSNDSNKTRKKGKSYKGKKEKNQEEKELSIGLQLDKKLQEKLQSQIRISTTLFVLHHHVQNCRDILVLPITFKNSVNRRCCHVSSMDMQ